MCALQICVLNFNIASLTCHLATGMNKMNYYVSENIVRGSSEKHWCFSSLEIEFRGEEKRERERSGRSPYKDECP